MNKFTAIFLIALIVCIPVSYAAIESPALINPVENPSEEETTSLIINVAKYEPSILVDAVVRETNAPIYVSLYGIPTTGKGVPKIKHISIRETDTNWLYGGVRYYPPVMYSWDNLGYFETKLKRIEKLSDIPETLDVNLVATIDFEAETTTQLVGAVQTRELKEKLKISRDELISQDEYKIFNKGYIIANRVKDKEVDFTIYGSEAERLGAFSLSTDEESREYRLIRGSNLNDDIIRIRLEKIIKSTDKPTVLFEVGAKDTEVKEGKAINENCKLADSGIKEDYVIIEKITEPDKGDTRKLVLQTSEERLVKDESYLFDFCGVGVLLKQIKTGNLAQVTFLPGRKRGTLETSFSLHIPVEKGLIGFTDKELERYLNNTQKFIDDMDDMIVKLEKVVENWRKVCLGMTAFLVIYKFFTPTELPEITAKLTSITGGVAADMPKLTNAEGSQLFLDKNNKKKACKGEKLNSLFDCGTKKEVYQNILYEKSTPYYYDVNTKSWIVYQGLDQDEAKNIYPTRTLSGESVIVVPIKFPENIPSGRFKETYTQDKEIHALDKGFYVIYYESAHKLEIYQAFGKIDLGSDDDRWVKTISEESPSYRDFENIYIKKVSTAQSRGKNEVDIDGDNKADYTLNTVKEFRAPDLSCEDIFCPNDKAAGSSCWQCVLLFNACDPVVCPSSRCDFGGIWKSGKSVVESGIVASLISCINNIKPSRGAVIVPFCLSGLLAGMKTVRSQADAVKACLLQQQQEGKTFGLCERIQSIYICEFFYKEIANLIMLYGGPVGGILALMTGGGVEYFTASLGDRTNNARRVADFFVQNYASDMYVNFLGKSTKEVGTEICKSFVGGKLPNIGDFVDQFATPEIPPQFTAHFEEQAYSGIAGNSRYMVYYHIYAGSLKGKTKLDYTVYLTKSGERDLIIARGTLTAEKWNSDTVTEIANSGYEQICVNIDGVPNCNFGKLVSSSWALDKLTDSFVESQATKPINSSSQCVSESSGWLGAPVERRCEASNPYLGRGEAEERKWTDVGTCGYDKRGVYLGRCWMKVQSQELIDLAKKDACNAEGISFCKEGETCKGETVYGKDIICCKGTCEPIPSQISLTSLKEETKFEIIEEPSKTIEEAQIDVNVGTYPWALTQLDSGKAVSIDYSKRSIYNYFVGYVKDYMATETYKIVGDKIYAADNKNKIYRVTSAIQGKLIIGAVKISEWANYEGVTSAEISEVEYLQATESIYIIQ